MIPTTIRNKALTAAQYNLLAKLATKYGVSFFESPTISAVVNNPCTHQSFVVDQNVAQLVKFVQIVYCNYAELGRMQYLGKPVAIGIYDRVRYLILAIDNATYANVID